MTKRKALSELKKGKKVIEMQRNQPEIIRSTQRDPSSIFKFFSKRLPLTFQLSNVQFKSRSALLEKHLVQLEDVTAVQ